MRGTVAHETGEVIVGVGPWAEQPDNGGGVLSKCSWVGEVPLSPGMTLRW